MSTFSVIEVIVQILFFFLGGSVADPGWFHPGSRSRLNFIPDPRSQIRIPDPTIKEKRTNF
jgi:hypothetical protein